MNKVRIDWDFMMPADFTPTPYALTLMEGSATGKNFKDFCAVYSSLEESMDIIVNGSSTL
jgi:hypothetical protein